MLISPTRTADGKPIGPDGVRADSLLVSIDQPAKADVAAFSGEAAAFEGWVMSRDPEPQVSVVVDGEVTQQLTLSKPRPDVLDFVGHDDPRDPLGFAFELPLEPTTESSVVVLEIRDREYVATSPPFHFHHSPQLAMRDEYSADAPSPLNAVGLFDGEWVSQLPGELAAVTGELDLFHDERIHAALDTFGGVDGARVLELGPMEGGHTYLLEQRGAAEVLAIEANSRCFLKCLVTKEVLGLTKSQFLHGDFLPYLRETDDHFDVVLASGVLYHQHEPLELLELLARVSDRVVLWTVYYDEARIEAHQRPRFTGGEVRRRLGDREIRLHAYQYGHEWETAKFSGGPLPGSRWMEREDILAALDHFGFRHQVVLPKWDEINVNGPAFLVAAWK